MIKLNFLLLFISSLFTTNLYSQELIYPISTRLILANYIFEGEIIESHPYYDASGKYINTSNTIEISKIFKGDISCGTIEMITKGGYINGDGVKYSHSVEVVEGSSGIFICENTQAPLSVIDFYPETNIQVLEPQFGVQSFIRYWWDGEDINASDLWGNYDSLAWVYSTVVTASGIAKIDCNSNPSFLKTEKVKPLQMPNYNSRKYQRILENMRIKHVNPNYSRSGEEVTFRMENFDISGIGSGNSFLEFDITIKDNVGTKYLSSAGIRLEYGNLSFGDSIVLNQKIEVTQIGLVADTNCYHAPVASDDTAQAVLIYIGEKWQATCRSQMLTTSQGLFHVKMKIDNCNMMFESLVLQDRPSVITNSVVGDMTTFDNDASSPTTITSYPLVIHSQFKTMVSCDPVITTFSPISVVGGVKDTLTIIGKRFGNVSGKVYFPNADDGGSSFVWTDSLDIISWTSNEIKLYVPSHSQGNYYNTTQNNQKAGSGGLKIVTAGQRSVYSQNLEIRTTLFNTANKGNVFITPHAAYNGRFEFNCTQALAAYKNGDAKKIIRKAIEDWACLTGIDWYLGADIPYLLDSARVDFQNVILFNPYLKANEIAIGSQSTVQISGSNVGWAREMDIEININKNLFCDSTGAAIPTGETDLYAAILHELGHCHGLGHVNGLNKIMSFKSASIRKIDLEHDLSCDEGGSRILWMSTKIPNPTLTAVGASKILVDSIPPCTHYVGIRENNKHIFEMGVYPNPVEDKLNININSEINIDVFIELFDIRGVLIHQVRKTIYVGDNILLVDTNFIAKGVYILNVSSKYDGRILNTKIVKE
jgi:hypothetical protein